MYIYQTELAVPLVSETEGIKLGLEKVEGVKGVGKREG